MAQKAFVGFLQIIKPATKHARRAKLRSSFGASLPVPVSAFPEAIPDPGTDSCSPRAPPAQTDTHKHKNTNTKTQTHTRTHTAPAAEGCGPSPPRSSAARATLRCSTTALAQLLTDHQGF